jgi:hypothetical protein
MLVNYQGGDDDADGTIGSPDKIRGDDQGTFKARSAAHAVDYLWKGQEKGASR